MRELRNVIETALIFAEDKELKKEDVETAVENLNEPDEHADTDSEAFRDSFAVEADPAQAPNGDPPVVPEDVRNRLSELAQTGTMSEITAYVTLMRYEAEIPHSSKQDIAERLQISVPTLDKYRTLAEENT